MGPSAMILYLACTIVNRMAKHQIIQCKLCALHANIQYAYFCYNCKLYFCITHFTEHISLDSCTLNYIITKNGMNGNLIARHLADSNATIRIVDEKVASKKCQSFNINTIGAIIIHT